MKIKFERDSMLGSEKATVYIGMKLVRLPDGTELVCKDYRSASTLADLINLLCVEMNTSK